MWVSFDGVALSPTAIFVATLGLAVATGIANHHTVILLAPLVCWGVFVAARERVIAGLGVVVGVLPGFAAYGTAKAALSYLTQELAQDDSSAARNSHNGCR